MTARLPDSVDVDAGALSRVFFDTTNSYKYLLFGAILRQLLARAGAAVFSLRELAVQMLVDGYYPCQVFRLSFGADDEIHKILRPLGSVRRTQEQLRQEVRALITPEIIKGLLRYVPFRLIRPFFAVPLRGVPDHRVNGLIAELADRQFDVVKPLYRILGDYSLEVHPDWIAYIRRNTPIVTDWFRWNWADFLRSRNPSVPSVSRKLSRPARRISLTRQTAYWRTVIEENDIHCIYSGRRLRDGPFALDHYLPWTFVTHDQLWNLVPVVPAANQAKLDRIPDAAYIDAVAGIHHQGLRTVSARHTRFWGYASEQFVVDLRVQDPSELLSEQALLGYLRATLLPLTHLALAMGFEGEWRFR